MLTFGRAQEKRALFMSIQLPITTHHFLLPTSYFLLKFYISPR